MAIFDGIPAQIQDANAIIQVSLMPKYKIKNKEVNKLREEFMQETKADQQMNQRPLKRIGKQDPGRSRQPFLNKFFMYASI